MPMEVLYNTIFQRGLLLLHSSTAGYCTTQCTYYEHNAVSLLKYSWRLTRKNKLLKTWVSRPYPQAQFISRNITLKSSKTSPETC